MRRLLAPLLASLALTTGAAGPAATAEASAAPRSTASACPSAATADPWFWDVTAATPFAGNIACLRYWQVTAGQADGSYRPGGHVTRAEMATFISRAITRSGGSLPAASRDHFRDDNTSPHHKALNALAEAGVMRGSTAGTVAPYQAITRIQMAALLVRAHDYRAAQAGTPALPRARDAFTDDNGHALAAEVDRAAAAGLVAGTGTATFQPSGAVRRDHMAAFLTRLLDLHVDTAVATVPAPPPAAPRPVAPKPAAPRAAQSVLTSLEQGVLNEINAYRRSKGLRALAVDSCLTSASRAWSTRLAQAGRLSHSSPSCRNRSWAENVAYHYDASLLFEAWRDSAGHRANMLRSGATKMGVGIVAVPDPSGHGTRYYATTQSD